MTQYTNTEKYYSGDNVRTAYERDSAEAIDMFATLKEEFPWVRVEEAFAVSSPVYHEVLEEPVVSFSLSNAALKRLVGAEYTLAVRKFCMDSKTSWMKVYPLWEDDDPYPDFMPEGCNILFKGIGMVEFGRPAPSGLDDFYDIFFIGDPATVEAHFNLPERRGAYDTYYGITVHNGEVARVKQYVYDEASIFPDWDLVYMAQKRRKAAGTL